MAEFQIANPIGAYIEGSQLAKRNKLADQEMQLRQNQFAAEQQQNAQSADAEKQKQLATQMYQITQYALQSPDSKGFLKQNYPQLAQSLGPAFEQMDDAGIKAKLTEGLGIWGPKAGIGPAVAPKPEEFTLSPGQKRYKGDQVVASVAPTPEKQPAQFRPMTKEEVTAAGLPAGTSAQKNDQTGQISVLSNPNSGNASGKTFRNVQALRKEFEGMDAVKNYKLVLPLYERAIKAPNTRAGDVSIIYALGKMFDPTSVVREGELVLSQNTAPWLQKIVSSANSQISGDGALNPETRRAIMEALQGQVEALSAPYNQERERFSGYADENGWAPNSIVGSDPSAAFGPRPPVANTGQPKIFPPKNARGWNLMQDAQGNHAYVGPNGEVEEVR